MTKKMSQRQALEFLAREGFEVPEEMTYLVKDLDYEQRGVVEVWKCACYEYESPIRVSAIFCPEKGHVMRRVWPKRL